MAAKMAAKNLNPMYLSSIYTRIRISGGHLGRHLGNYVIFVIAFFIIELWIFQFILIDTAFVFVPERRAEIHQILIFGGHFWPPSWKICNWCYWFHTYSYSTTFISYESTLYLSLYSKGELRYTIVTFGGHLDRHLGKYATDLDDFYKLILYDLYFIWFDTLYL